MVLKKKTTERNVYEAALERFHILFDRFDTVVVSFSGGKDSTVALNLALEVARERGRLPLHVYHWDEEAIHPQTVEYVRRVSQLPDVEFKWLCVPIRHRNACSRTQPWWYPWHPDDRERWCRPMPEEAITTVPGFYHGATVPDLAHKVYGPEYGRVADVRGLRADESLNRYRSVARRERDNWIGAPRDGYSYPVSPIYDWTSIDVWVAPHRFGWDYNRTYDVMAAAGISVHDQRVCPPYGEEPLRGLWQYQVCWPELWDKMVHRVHGAATAARYSRSELYGFGDLEPPPGMSWRQWLFNQLEMYGAKDRATISKSIQSAIAMHRRKTGRPVPDRNPDPTTGISWAYLAMMANRGDLKGRRRAGMSSRASQARAKLGISLAESLGLDDNEGDTRY